MSTLGNVGAVAGGILGGMRMKQALDQQKLEEERLREEMKWRREDREYQKGERARAEQERAERDAFYGGMRSAKFAQPGEVEREAVMVPADPNAPDEPTMGVARAEQTPRSEIAKVGMKEVFRDKPRAFDYNVIDKDMETLNGFHALAYKLRDQGALSMVEGKKKEVYARYLSMFDGDPMKDPAGFAQHAAKVSARFGSPLTPEQAFQYAKASKAYEQEGALDALKLANSGNKAAALKLYNATGNHKFADLELTPAKSAYGINSFNIVGVNADGTKENIGNAMDAMISLMTGKEQVDLALTKQKMDADIKNAERDDARAEKTSAAAINASNASAAASYANAAQTKEETKWMRENKGAKPGAASTYKVEMNEVAQAFSTPATDEKGKPIVDLMTGRQIVNRNPEKEREFMQWMAKNNITDTNKGLALYLGGGAQQPSASGYDSYVNAFNKAKAAGNKQAMQELTNAARSAGIVK